MNCISKIGVTAGISAIVAIVHAVEIMPSFIDSFNPLLGGNNKSVEQFYYGSGGKKADFTWYAGVPSKIEESSSVLKLSMDPAEQNGAWQGPNMTSNGYIHFGTCAARLKIPSVTTQPNVGGVVGFYSYYNDQWNTELPADMNKNGLYDNSEIDFEWLIADPTIIYLTAWTDHQELPTSNACRKVSRIINLAKGTIYETVYSEEVGGEGTKLVGVENQPSTIAAIPGFDASKQFYTYGFDWKSDQIRWWIIHPDTKDTVVLWDYRGPKERITQKEASLMLNIWYTNDWPVYTNSKSIEAPKDTFSVEFDWVSYKPFDQTASAVTRSQKSLMPKALVTRTADGSRLKMDRSGTYDVQICSLRGAILERKQFCGMEMDFHSFGSPVVLRISQNGNPVAVNLVPRF